jgi:hypothetical protein
MGQGERTANLWVRADAAALVIGVDGARRGLL